MGDSLEYEARGLWNEVFMHALRMNFSINAAAKEAGEAVKKYKEQFSGE